MGRKTLKSETRRCGLSSEGGTTKIREMFESLRNTSVVPGDPKSDLTAIDKRLVVDNKPRTPLRQPGR